MAIDLKYEIRDVIHGLVRRTSQEVAITNTNVFQRLRRIKQLALAELVYPGAHHNRFEHCVGTMHIAGRIAHKFFTDGVLKEDDVVTIRLAGLLHDIGHGPFSHIAEHLLDKYHKFPQEPGVQIHELVTRDIIESDPELRDCLSEQHGKVLGLLYNKETRDFKKDIVSSPLDADKLDYLLRDSYYCGVRYGVYDLEKVIDSLRVIPFGSESFLGIDEEGIYALEQLIMAKHHMTTQVYFHRIRAITDAMIVRGIELAIEEGLNELKEAFTYARTPAFLKGYSQLYDSYVIDLIMKKGGELSKEFFERLFHRRLFKLVYEKPLSEIKGVVNRSRYVSLKDEERLALETAIAEQLGIRREYVIVNSVSVKNPTYRSPVLTVDDETILVRFSSREKEPERLGDIKESILNLANPLSKTHHIQVFGALDYLNDMAGEEKEKERKRLGKEISEIIEK